MMDSIGSWESYLRQTGFRVGRVPTAASQIGAHFRIDFSNDYYLQDVKLPCYAIVTTLTVRDEFVDRIRSYVSFFEENVLLLRGEPDMNNTHVVYYHRSLRSAHIRPVISNRITSPAQTADMRAFPENSGPRQSRSEINGRMQAKVGVLQV